MFLFMIPLSVKADSGSEWYNTMYDVGNSELFNYVFNTYDSHVLYFTLLPRVSVDNFNVEVTNYYQIPDSLDVWEYEYLRNKVIWT